MSLVVHAKEAAPGGWMAGYTDEMEHRWRAVEQIVTERVDDGGRVLHAGAVPPGLQYLVESAGYKTVGVDVAPDRAAGMTEWLQLDVRRADLDTPGLPFEPDSFDAVVCSEVIEHLHRPERALRSFRDVLRPGGELILTTPNYGRIETRVRALAGASPARYVRAREKGDERGHTGHVRLFDLAGLRQLVEREGFHVARHDPVEFGPARFGFGLLYRAAPSLRPFQVMVAVA